VEHLIKIFEVTVTQVF